MTLRTVCAWCEAEGVVTVIHEGDEDGPISHGICAYHAQQHFGLPA